MADPEPQPQPQPAPVPVPAPAPEPPSPSPQPPTQADNAYENMKSQAIVQIGNVSKLLREAIAATIPVAPEQYLTIAIPGTTIDVREIRDGGTFVYDAEKTAFPPMQVQQAESKLVDNMIPLAHVMIGNTGKSVARSYSRALDILVARKVPVVSASGNIRIPGEPEYDKAMEYLTTKLADVGMTPVELYVVKQKAWAAEQDAWDVARIKAKQDAISNNPSDTVAAKAAYDQWNQANFRKYKTAVQGRYMDWVTNGNKYEVEMKFAIVDVDAIMTRVEHSKEAIRNSVFVDEDGANEINVVALTPKNWAGLCKQKTEGWFKKNGEYSLDQLNGEIARLKRVLKSYESLDLMMGATTQYPINTTEDKEQPVNTSLSDSTLMTKYTDLYKAEAKMNLQNKKIRIAKTDEEKKKVKDADVYIKAVSELKTKRKELASAIEENNETHAQASKYALTHLTEEMKPGVQAWLAKTITNLKQNITALEDKRGDKTDIYKRVPVIQGADKKEGEDDTIGTSLLAPGDEEPIPRFGVGSNAVTHDMGNQKDLPAAGTMSDPWVQITASFSAADQKSEEKKSNFGFSTGGSIGWGLWSAGGSYARNSEKSDSSSDMASCDVSVSFQALVVNIRRPWLHGELFADAELDVANGLQLSPGPKKLHEWMQAQKADSTKSRDAVAQLAKYGLFPAYPTSFIIAADTSIEFQGSTQHIEKHFSSASSSGSASVGWGPWSAKSSFSKSETKQSFQMQSTATGCRLCFGAPQIIGWVSQILPELPRQRGFEPMVQTTV